MDLLRKVSRRSECRGLPCEVRPSGPCEVVKRCMGNEFVWVYCTLDRCTFVLSRKLRSLAAETLQLHPSTQSFTRLLHRLCLPARDRAPPFLRRAVPGLPRHVSPRASKRHPPTFTLHTKQPPIPSCQHHNLPYHHPAEQSSNPPTIPPLA